jgi:hypothetical protein
MGELPLHPPQTPMCTRLNADTTTRAKNITHTQLCRSIKICIILCSMSLVNPWDVISIIVGHSNRCKTILTMYFRYRNNRRVVIMVVWREADTKDIPKVDMGTVTKKDMEEGVVDPPLLQLWRNWPSIKFFHQAMHTLCILL